MDNISELEIAAWHEAAHACVGLRLKQVPQLIEVSDNGGGLCRFKGALGSENALLVGMAGELVCEEMLGVPGTASQEDVSLTRPQWVRLYASGQRDRVQQHVIRQASSLCWELKPQIECLADRLMKIRRIDEAKLGSLCRSYPALSQFKGMFLRPQLTQAVAARRQSESQPSLAVTPVRQLALRPRESASFRDRLIARAFSGRGIVFGIPREHVQRMFEAR